VLVGRERVEAGLGVEARSREAGQPLGQKLLLAFFPRRIGVKSPAVSGDGAAAEMLAKFRGQLAVHGYSGEIVPAVAHEHRKSGLTALGAGSRFAGRV